MRIIAGVIVLPKKNQFSVITNQDKKPNAKVAFDTLQLDLKKVSSSTSHPSTANCKCYHDSKLIMQGNMDNRI